MHLFYYMRIFGYIPIAHIGYPKFKPPNFGKKEKVEKEKEKSFGISLIFEKCAKI